MQVYAQEVREPRIELTIHLNAKESEEFTKELGAMFFDSDSVVTQLYNKIQDAKETIKRSY